MAVTTYNWHSINMTVASPSDIWRIITTVITWPQFPVAKTNTKASTAATLTADFTAEFNGAKQEIDAAVSAAAANTPDEWTWVGGWTDGWTDGNANTEMWNSSYTENINPAPQIVWWPSAEAPTAWVNYQFWRNDLIAWQIKNQMSWTQYASWTQAEQSFRERLMSAINSTGWSIQINLQTWVITWTPVENWANTANAIKTKVLQMFWVSSWNQLAQQSWWNGTWNGTPSEEEWSTTDITNPTENADVNASWQAIQDQANQISEWLTSSFDANLAEWQDRLSQVPDVAANIADRITSLNSSFASATSNLKAAWELERKAQAIYSNENINNMKDQLVAKWFDAGKAWPAVFFKAMKDRATISAEIYKLQADQEKTLADLETKRWQLVDSIKASWLAADQWVFEQVNELTKQMETLRNNYDTQRIALADKYTVTPMINIMNSQREADLQNLADKYNEQFLNANPSQKIVAAARIYWSDWAYVSSAVALNTSWTFGEYLWRCADSIREWKIAEASASASTTTINTWTTPPTYTV